MADENRLFRVEIISPDRIFYEDEVTMLELTTSEGEIGIFKGHIPLTAIVVPGIVTLTKESEKKKAAVHSGFLEILPDKVTVMAELAEWPEEIDINRANEAKIRAERHLKSSEPSINFSRAEFALRKSLVRIKLAEERK